MIYSYIMILKTMRQSKVRGGKVNKVETKVTRMIAIMIIGKYYYTKLLNFISH